MSHKRWALGLTLATAVLASAQYIPNRYIVELSGEAAAAPAVRGQRRSRTEIPGRRAEVRVKQRTMRTSVEQVEATVLDSVDTVANALIVHATAEQAKQIASLSGVKRIHKMRRFKPTLEAAIPLHGVDLAWARIGQDQAGAGIKIAIIDSGIDNSHAGLQDPSLAVPESFPKVNSSSDVKFTNNKVIVARSYASLFESWDPDESARDHVGHGTALAMCAAGVAHEAPIAAIAGVAPKAYLGSYKVLGTPGFNDYIPEAAVLKALDDAVADGMDVINLSFGAYPAQRLEDDIEVRALETATSAGALVIVSAGNEGPEPLTISSPATSPDAIAVGASHNARALSPSVTVGSVAYLAVNSGGALPSDALTAALADVAELDGNGLACSRLPEDGLTGRIALILRGACSFEAKLNNARAAGAAAAAVYAAPDSPDAITMAVGRAALPAQMVSSDDGLAIKKRLQAAEEPLSATMQFASKSAPIDPYRVTSFSSAGPNVDGSIKPDLLAAGGEIYTATQTFDAWSDMYDASGYVYANGTSFSAPIVTGAAALLKGARPGFTIQQYRSMLVNTATPLEAAIPQQGAGLLNVDAALNTTALVWPTKLSFGVAGRNPSLSQTLSVTNLGAEDEVFAAAVTPRTGDSAAPTAASQVAVAAGGTAELSVEMPGEGLAAGAYQGHVTLTGQTTGTTLRVPYWFAIPDAPASVTVFYAYSMGRAGSTIEDAIDFRVLDAAGVPLTDTPTVTMDGGGDVLAVTLREEEYGPGMFSVDLKLGRRRGMNTVHIRAGDVGADVVIVAR